MKYFDLSDCHKISDDLYVITKDYRIHHFDEVPILYSGTNRYNNKIVGSFLYEDDERRLVYDLHTIMFDKDYFDFVSRKITYREVLKSSKAISLVVKGYDNKVKDYYAYDYSLIPDEYKPLEKSYFPKNKESFSLMFSIYLKGMMANYNKAIPKDVSKIIEGFTELLEQFNILKEFGYSPVAALKPSGEGSYKINFELELKDRKGIDLFIDERSMAKYINKYIQYLTNDFVDEKKMFYSESDLLSENFRSLERMILDIYSKSHIKKPKKIQVNLKQDIVRSANTISSMAGRIGSNFDNMQIINIENDYENILSYIDRECAIRFNDVVEEVVNYGKKIQVDDEYKNYQIYIYHLNVDSRTGNAHIKSEWEKDKISKPKLKINGDAPLDGTKYTESMHLREWITVKARATKIDGKYNKLDVLYENE